jgi:hypothetical protein
MHAELHAGGKDGEKLHDGADAYTRRRRRELTVREVAGDAGKMAELQEVRSGALGHAAELQVVTNDEAKPASAVRHRRRSVDSDEGDAELGRRRVRRRTAQKWPAAEIDAARTAEHACVDGLADIDEAPVRTETRVLRRPDEVEDERVGCRCP